MSDGEIYTEPLHLFEQLASLCAEITGGVGAVCVSSRAVVCGSYSTQALRIRALEMFRRDDRVSAFEAQDVPDRESAFAAARLRRDNLRLICKRRLAVGSWLLASCPLIHMSI